MAIAATTKKKCTMVLYHGIYHGIYRGAEPTVRVVLLFHNSTANAIKVGNWEGIHYSGKWSFTITSGIAATANAPQSLRDDTTRAQDDPTRTFFFFHPITSLCPYFSLSLQVVTQIRGHTAGASSPPSPLGTTVPLDADAARAHIESIKVIIVLSMLDTCTTVGRHAVI